MSVKNHDTDPTADDLVDLTSELFKGVASEPVPHHLVELAQQLQAALEQQTGKNPEPTDMPEQSEPEQRCP